MGTPAHVAHGSPAGAYASSFFKGREKIYFSASFFKGHESNYYLQWNCNISTGRFSMGVINEKPAIYPTALVSKEQS